MATPDYFQNQGTGKEARDIWNKAYHRAKNSAHEWEQGHEGDYCIYDGKLWRFGVDTVGANRNDTPGEIDSESNGSWLPFSDSTVTQQDIDNAVAAIELLPGPQGEAGAAGADGADGTNGLDGESAYQIALNGGFVGTEAAWLSSLVGPQGTQGTAGSQGVQGIKGDTGDTGAVGADGPQGIQGVAGADGNDGAQGVAGTDGADGSGVTIVGSVANAAALPVSYGGSAGDMYITSNDGHGHVWNGATWDDVGQIQGPQGIQGIQGAAGIQGIQGVQGLTGDTGLQGLAGDDGVQGIQGIQGVAGNDGVATPDLGYLFADSTERDAFTAWDGLICITIDNDSWFEHVSSAWVAYTGAKPFYIIGSVAVATAETHLAPGTIYDEAGA